MTLHNSLIVSLFDTSAHLAPPTPPPDVPKQPPRKRRRTLPYQGPGNYDPATLRSLRIKKWTIGLGKRERERIRSLEPYAAQVEPQLEEWKDEIVAERGVKLLPERGGTLCDIHGYCLIMTFSIEPAGSRLQLYLASMTRAPTLQHISDRINLISAQHNLGAPPKAVSSLMMLAFEVCLQLTSLNAYLSHLPKAKLKQLITQALSLTSTSHAITSIKTSTPHSNNYHLSASSFDTLFTISPAVLPNKSAAAMRLALGEDDAPEEEPARNNTDGGDEALYQLLALLQEQRSTVRDCVRQSGRR